MKSYADFGKIAKKLLNDDYVSGKSVEVKTATDNGLAFTASGTELSKDGSLLGTLSFKYLVYGNLFTTKVMTTNTISTEAVFENLGVHGLKATLNGAISNGKQSAIAKIDYVNDQVATTALVDIPNKIVIPSVAVGYKNVAVGADAVFTSESNNAAKYSAGATMLHRDSEITVTANDKFKNLKVAFSHIVSPGFAVGAEATYNVDSKNTGMTAGIMYITGGNTMRLKSNDEGLLSLAYATRIDKATTLTMSTTTNVKEMEKGQKFGISLTLNQP
eukprot:Plantae.Rhodophyta-Purpureofilum_apyrenoidigerum.ctg11657.p1 GENE.Plantae.Rhodophyta-Purpureofilum_apyrenoidigerum.ctg11657~~Plantae.Rhodophyta-Purpureofilum_apyrenoidigerum.ctg11657.p1  ORF type:complete len:274 (+),score=66.34 Plantae.Rhodophyta-Purpureofilum_apyrenoidigerum.ctg11657:99-920(+)